MSKGQIERRFLALDGLELRTAEGQAPELVGYAAVFNQATTVSGLWSEWSEEVAPGAFSKTIQEADIRALFNHDSNIVLGRNKAGTLQLSEDAHGLRAVIRPPDNEWGRPVLDAIRRGDITGMSIAFVPVKQEWYKPEKGSGEMPKRTIREAKLYDVSPVTFPAFEQTSISARALDDDDPLMRAWGILQCARAGMPLDADERAAIGAAAEYIRSLVPTAEPVTDHSDAQPDEPAYRGHSPQERQRVLEQLQAFCGGRHDD